MDPKRKKIILMVGLVIIFAWLLVDLIIKTSDGNRTEVTAIEEKRTKITSQIFNLDKMKEIKKMNLRWGRDPFYFDVIEEDVAPLKLDGILWDDAHPQAILNDDIVGVGAVISGYTIDTIAEQYVILKKGSKEKKLQLY